MRSHPSLLFSLSLTRVMSDHHRRFLWFGCFFSLSVEISKKFEKKNLKKKLNSFINNNSFIKKNGTFLKLISVSYDCLVRSFVMIFPLLLAFLVYFLPIFLVRSVRFEIFFGCFWLFFDPPLSRNNYGFCVEQSWIIKSPEKNTRKLQNWMDSWRRIKKKVKN